MFFIEPGTALGIGLEAFEHRSLASLYRTRIWNLIRRGHLRIVIFGSGGTGKTTLGHLLAGKDLHDASKGSYRESIFVESYRLAGEVFCTILVPPGQTRRAEREWPDAFRRLSRSKYTVVINVVSWGYHSFSDFSYTETPYYQPGMSPTQFMSVYGEVCRRKELDVIAQLVPHLQSPKKKVRLLTIVTKQDLWWDDRKQVQEYYEQGPYSEQIHSIASKRGTESFAHEYVSACLIMNNLATSKGELLVPTTGGYDEVLKRRNLAYLCDVVSGMVSR